MTDLEKHPDMIVRPHGARTGKVRGGKGTLTYGGMVTSEYAVGSVVAVAGVALLIKVIDMRPVFRLMVRLWEWVFTVFGG